MAWALILGLKINEVLSRCWMSAAHVCTYPRLTDWLGTHDSILLVLLLVSRSEEAFLNVTITIAIAIYTGVQKTFDTQVAQAILYSPYVHVSFWARKPSLKPLFIAPPTLPKLVAYIAVILFVLKATNGPAQSLSLSFFTHIKCKLITACFPHRKKIIK